MKAFLSTIIMPVPILWIILFTAIIFLVLKKNKIAKIVFAISIIWLFIISTPFVPNYLINNLEKQYRQLKNPKSKVNDSIVNILVLGGGHKTDERLSYNNQLSEASLSRLSEGIRLQRLIPNSKLIVSGYNGDDEQTQALVLKKSAISLGVNDKDVFLLEKPKNTKEEAKFYSINYGKTGTLVLVTSASHMPRAVMEFQKLGIKPIPAPANQSIKHSKTERFKWIPSSSCIKGMEIAIHEYVGMLVSKLE